MICVRFRNGWRLDRFTAPYDKLTTRNSTSSRVLLSATLHEFVGYCSVAIANGVAARIPFGFLIMTLYHSMARRCAARLEDCEVPFCPLLSVGATKRSLKTYVSTSWRFTKKQVLSQKISKILSGRVCVLRLYPLVGNPDEIFLRNTNTLKSSKSWTA